MKKVLFFMVLSIISTGVLFAQTISQYTYSTATNGSLEDMSSGTTDLLPTGTNYYLVSSAIANLGFNFNFGANVFTQFSINSSGQMQLGGTVISTNANPEAGKSILAPIANGVSNNSIRDTGKVHFKVIGTAPNRKLVVEWVNIRIPYATYAESGTYGTFQVWLNETSNVVNFVYGTMWRMGTLRQQRGIFIATSNAVGSVGNIKTITTTPTWDVASATLITTPFDTNAMINLNSSANGSRRVFTFTPPVVSTPPNPAVLVSPVLNGWAYTDATLNWEGNGGAPSSYDVYFGTSPTPPFVVNQAAGYYTPTLDAGTTYYWKVVPKNAFGDAVGSPTWSFKTPSTTQIAESFESTTWPPAGWSNPNGFSRTTTPGFAYHGAASTAKATSTTAAYVLSTPKSTITASSTLDFYSMASTTTRISQVVYSTDRVSWTQIGANITYAATNTWYRNVINLSSLAGQDYYLGFRTPAQTLSGNVYFDYVFGPEIALEAPGQVSLTSPINGFGAVIVQPTLTWTTNTTTGGVPSEYKVYLDTNTDPSTLVATVPTLSYTFPTPLNETTLYYWKVIASNSAGDAPPSAIRSFTTTVNPPLAATNPSPMDTATGVPVNAILSWDAMANTSYYKLYFGTTLPTTATANITANSWTPPTMTGGATYYWKVVPFHTNAGEAINNSIWSFTTYATPPPVVTNPYPADAAVNVAINAALSWTPSPGASSYDVYFGTTLPGTANATVTAASWTPPVMNNNTAYQWMVVPVNNNGSPTNNATWGFTTIVALPQAAVNPVPVSGSFNVATNASLAWDAVAGASSYDVYFGTTLPALVTASVSTPTWTPPVMANATVYQWKVIPRNIAGGATGAVTWSFTTVTALPLAATNPNPADGATGVLTNASLYWSPVTNAASYDIYFGTTLSAFAIANVTIPTWTPPLIAGTSYQWMVVPKNAGGSAIANATWSFTTVYDAPAPAVNPVPADMATDVATDASLAWDAVPTATSYDVYFGENLPLIANANVSITNWTPPLMNNNTAYQWMVVPMNAGGSAIGNATWSFTTIIAAPLAAVNPVPADMATGVSIDAVLAWDEVTSATSYDVYFGETLPLIANANVSITNWTPPLMNNNTAYQWMVVPMNAGGSAIGNATWSFTTIIAAPLAAVNPVPADMATGVAIDAVLAWDEVTSATSYDVYFGETLPLIANANVSITTWTPPTMDNDATYQWMVVPMNAAGSALGNATWTFTTIPLFNPPTDLLASAGINLVNLSWVAPLVGIPSGYNIYRDTILITPVPVSGLTYEDTDVALLSTYSYAVTAVYSSPDGESVPSNLSEAGPTENMPTPTGLAASVNVYEVTLTWAAPGRNQQRASLGYNLYRDSVLLATISDLGTLSYIDNVGPGSYSYTITESYTMGDSPVSDAVIADVLISNAPTGLALVRSANSISFGWDAIPGAASYNIYFSDTPTGVNGWQLLSNTATNAFIDIDPIDNMRFYQVTVVSP